MSSGSTRALDAGQVAERAARARAFLDGARMWVTADTSAERAVGVSSAVEAGIAAADAICGHLLGVHSRGDDHKQAVALLHRALPKLTGPGNALDRLLDVKPTAQYGSGHMSPTRAGENLTRAETLVTAMEDVLSRQAP